MKKHKDPSWEEGTQDMVDRVEDNMTPQTKQWKIEFDEIMPENWSDNGVSRLTIKAFIAKTRKEAVSDFAQEVEERLVPAFSKYTRQPLSDWKRGWNEALDNVEEALQTLLEEYEK